MLKSEWNKTGISSGSYVHDLLFQLFEELEIEKYSKIPGQREVVSKLREYGWDRRVNIGYNSKHHIDGVLEKVGVCVYFGHREAAFQRLLAIQSLFEDGVIEECFYITQTNETAEKRHQKGDPNKKGNGNRISFYDIDTGMEYYNRFITVPLTLIGIEFDD